MTGYLIDYKGNEYKLPVLFSWSVVHTMGVPSDNFEISCPYDGAMRETLSDATCFRGIWRGDTVFYGVVDEYEVNINENGRTVSIAGRGNGARLLDNESEAMEYGACSLEDILTNHVRPCGITEINAEPMPVVSSYTVQNGSSQWKALEEFCRYSEGVLPRFSKDGRLVLSKRAGEKRKLGGAVYDINLREKRHGIISEILVKDTYLGTSGIVENAEFIARGGACRRIITVPRKTGYDAMRYTGRYQIEQSKKDSFVLSLTVPKLFAAFPNDTVEINLAGLGITGEFKVNETECWADGRGAGTRMKLAKSE